MSPILIHFADPEVGDEGNNSQLVVFVDEPEERGTGREEGGSLSESGGIQLLEL